MLIATHIHQKEHDDSCSRYTIPVRVIYNKQTKYVKEGFIDEVKQRKGEAVMAKVDWLLDADIRKRLEIRQLSIKPPNKDLKHPQNWMPPKSALQQFGKLVQCQLDYFGTIGSHDASLPNFISEGCLSKLDDGSIQIDLGSETFIQDRKSLITIEENTLNEKLRECQQSEKKSRATHSTEREKWQKGTDTIYSKVL
ncbi:unnamed protein product [Mytilus coruscus]|uniref:Uncharacterized protein n=1 Tax=Mytilus coruscus TaxID=42192 RepID=A0A6J8BNC5_MYTCO|nr:unnamed protein product [Mytilus coruscus]